MRHTIELSEAGEASLRDLARSAGQDENDLLSHLARTLLDDRLNSELIKAILEGHHAKSNTFQMALAATGPAVQSTPDVMGGDACLRNTRIPVWMVVGYKRAGYSDERILANYPSLRAADLSAAWEFYAANAERVEHERRRHEEAD